MAGEGSTWLNSLSNEQDLRKLGGLFKVLPYIYILILFYIYFSWMGAIFLGK